MRELYIKMFGSPEILVDGRPVTMPYRKAEALLYYLVLERRAARRDLIDLLWEETDPAAALKNLRHAAYTVRKQLGRSCFSPASAPCWKSIPRCPCAVMCWIF